MARFQQCIETIRSAAPSLTQDEAVEMLETVEEIVDGKRTDSTVADLQRSVRDAVAQDAEQAERAALIEKRNAALRLQVRQRLQGKIRHLADTAPKEVGDYLESLTVGLPGDSVFKESIETTQRTLEQQTNALLVAQIEARGVDRRDAMAFLRSRDATRLLLAEADNPGSTGSKTANVVAEAMEAANEFLAHGGEPRRCRHRQDTGLPDEAVA